MDFQKKGIFIAFEGPEGCGKSTQVKLFTDFLKEKQIDYILTREPGGTKVGEEIRKILLDPENSMMEDMTEAYLYASSRSQLVREVIRPALTEGKIVITDRYVDSSIVYQGVGRELGIERVMKLNENGIEGLYPDLTFILLVEPETGLRRAADASKKDGYASGDRLEMEKLEFHKKIYLGFKELENHRENLAYINGVQKVSSVFEDIKNHFLENFGDKYVV